LVAELVDVLDDAVGVLDGAVRLEQRVDLPEQHRDEHAQQQERRERRAAEEPLEHPRLQRARGG
jgi:hypothetical protein